MLAGGAAGLLLPGYLTRSRSAGQRGYIPQQTEYIPSPESTLTRALERPHAEGQPSAAGEISAFSASASAPIAATR